MTQPTQAPADYPLWLAHEHMRLYLSHYTPGHNVYDTVSAALASQPAQAGAWRDHVEQRLHSWRQRFVNKSGDQLALDDFMDKQSLDDLIDYVCSEYEGPPTPPQAQPAPVIDVEAMLRCCVPGGSVCDPQQVADSIREWFKRPAPVAVDERELLRQAHAQMRHLIDDLSVCIDDDGMTRYVPRDASSLLFGNLIGALIPLCARISSALQSARSGQAVGVALDIATEALDEIALAGMSGTGQESEEAMRDWHARQAWKFIGIAARAKSAIYAAIATSKEKQG